MVSVPLSGLAYVNEYAIPGILGLGIVSVPLSGLAYVNAVSEIQRAKEEKEFPSPYRG